MKSAELRPLSIEAYHVLGEVGVIPKNTELLYGFVYTKRSKSPFHSALVRKLARMLRAACPPGFFVDTEQPITCADSEPEPDIFVVRGDEEDFWQQHPQTAELVIEVCISSHDFDRSKLRAYALAGVKEVWFVLGPEKQIEVFRFPKAEGFEEQTMFGPGGVVTSSTLPTFTVNLERLFAK